MKVSNLFSGVTLFSIILFALLLFISMLLVTQPAFKVNRAKYLALFIAGSAVLMSIVAIVMIRH